MGYIKKLKNNELVGGTDKTTIYPVTSTEAVFEEVIEDGESNFKSQKFLNNNITGDRINGGTITGYNIAEGTITKEKLTPQVQTMLDEGQKKALTPKGNYNSETEYEALDLVFDPVTNSSYISLVTPNVGHPVDENAEGYEEGWWEKTLDGTAVNTAQAAIDAKVGQLETQVGTAITQAETAVDEAKQETLNAYTQAEALAQQITDWSSSEISSTPSYTDQHPLSNRASSAQIGYFECGTSSTTQASNQIKAVTAGGYALPTSGGAVKIKMCAANTYTPTTNNPVKLQFNADATTLKELRYNDEAVSPSNTWDAGEVLSVYYDGTYYQASNAQGGGSAVGKKKLTPIPGYIENNGTTLGSIHTASADRTNYRYIKYPAKEGDVVQISGTGTSAARLWGIVGEEDVMLDAAATNLSAKDLIVVMPEGTAFITINSKTDSNPEWYYAKTGSAGAHEMLSEAYLYGGLKNFSVGQIYDKNDVVKTVYNQRFKIIKEVKAMNLTNEIAIGDLKAITSGTNLGTYQAQRAISAYSDTTYSDGDYAIGSPAGAVIQVSVDSTAIAALEEATDITVTIAGIELTVTVDSTMDAAGVAAAIYAAFGTQDEWKLTNNGNGTLTLISKVAKAAAPTISATTGDTGITVQFIENSAYAGSLNVSTFDGNTWTALTIGNYVAINDIWEQKGIDWLINNITEPDRIQAVTIPYDNSNSSLSSNNVNDAIDETAKYSGEILYYKEATAIAQQNTNFSLLTDFGIIKNHTYRLYIKSGANLINPPYTTIKIGIGGANVSSDINVEDITNGYVWEFVGSKNSASSRVYLNTPRVSNVKVYVKIEDVTTPSTIMKDTRVTTKAKISELDSAVTSIANSISNVDETRYKFIDVTEKVGNLITNDVNYITVDSSAEEHKQNGTATIVAPASSKRFGWYIGALPNNTDIVIDMDIISSNSAGYADFCRSYVTDNNIYSIYTGQSGPAILGFRPLEKTAHITFTFRRGDSKHLQVPNGSLFAGQTITITNFQARLRYSFPEYDRLKHLTESFKLKATVMKRVSGDNGTNKDNVLRNASQLSLLHFSDIHGDGTAAYFIRDFYENNKTCIDDMLSTGDVAVLSYSDDYEFYRNNKLNEALFCIGNHDGAVGSNWDATPRENVYNKYIAPNAESWGIVQPESPDNPLYWYKDYTTQQVRLICIDGVYSQEDTDYLNAELSWFRNLLNETLPNSGSTVQGWKVVVCSHYYPASFNEASIVKNNNGNPVNMHNYGSRELSPSEGTKINAGFLTALSTFIDNGGKFVIWLCGHYHAPFMAYLANYSNILVMAADAAGTYRGGNMAPAKRVSDLQYSFIANVLVINDSFVRIIRVGCNSDIYLRDVNTLTYDWVNKKVISEN